MPLIYPYSASFRPEVNTRWGSWRCRLSLACQVLRISATGRVVRGRRVGRPSGRPPPRQDERPACLRRPHQRREEVLAWLLAATPVGTTAPTLAGQRHPVATAGLRARGDREPPCGHGPDLCSLAAPEREAPTRATRYTYLDHRVPPVWSGPRGVGAPLGQLHFRRPYLRSAPWGRKSAGTKGAQGL